MPLSLWRPYPLYRRGRLAQAQAPLIGWLVLGLPLAVAALLREEDARWRSAPMAVALDWLLHLAAVVPVVAWLAPYRRPFPCLFADDER